MNIKYLYFLISTFLCITFSFAQSMSLKKDSVKNILRQSFIDVQEGKNIIALEKQRFVVEWSKFNKNDSVLASAYNVIATNHMNLEDYSAAETYLKRAIKFGKKSNNQTVLMLIYNNYGRLNMIKGNTDKAIEYFELSLKISEDPNTFNNNKLWTVMNIGSLYHQQKKYNKARHYYNETIRYFEPNSQHQPEILVNAYLNLGDLDLIDKNYTNALNQLKIADSLALDIKDYNLLVYIEHTRYEVFLKTKQKDKAITALEKKTQYLEEKIKAKNEINKKSQKLKQDLQDQLKSLEIKDKVYNAQQHTLNITRLFSICLLLLLAVILLIAYLLNRSNTKNKKLNKDLIIKNKQLLDSKQKTEYAANLKENFFSTISHELRTPLYAVNGITDILIDENPKPEQKKHLKILKSSGEYLLAIINNVLQINKLDKKAEKLYPINFNLRELLENTKNSLNYIKKDNNNIITIDIDDNLPKTLHGDALKISQVLNNLVSNSLKFTENGTIIIRVEIVNKNTEDIELKISIIDDGIGISKDMQEYIFNDFYQESMRLDRNYEGIGLGLTIVKRLLKILNSEIKVTSEENKGATFCFNIILNYTDVDEIEHIDANQFSLLENAKILVVDDNKVNQLISKRVLDKEKVSTTLVYNGLNAINKIKTNHYDLILMDIHMPGMDGYETTRQIRTFNKTTPIIALTAVQLEGKKEKILESGMNDIIVKPYKKEFFYKKICEHLK